MRTLRDALQPVSSTSACKVCQGEAPLNGVTDFNKNCEERNGPVLPLTGVPVFYHRCTQCGLVFTRAFDHWDKSDYLRHIYNHDYVLVDPDYIDSRPANFAALVADFIKAARGLKCLDYGGGNGRLTALLRERGIDGTSWDPMGEDGDTPPAGPFDFISAFEVLEHTPEPAATVGQALDMLAQGGVMLFSTLTIDALPPRSMDFWYIAPRNGHITVYTRKSLQTLFGGFGFRVHHFNYNLHLAMKEAPAWLS
jgi:SAM-dependent methyltransferase